MTAIAVGTTLDSLVAQARREEQARRERLSRLRLATAALTLADAQRDLRVRFSTAFGATLLDDLDNGGIDGGRTGPVAALFGEYREVAFSVSKRELPNVTEWYIRAEGRCEVILVGFGDTQRANAQALLVAIDRVTTGAN